MRIPKITMQTDDPITLFGLNINPIKITLKEIIAKMVVYGNHLTLKSG